MKKAPKEKNDEEEIRAYHYSFRDVGHNLATTRSGSERWQKASMIKALALEIEAYIDG